MSQIYFVRLVLEATSPLAISSGQRETLFDNQLARDANGLPYIPGTSLAGVWRAVAGYSRLDIDINSWFGSSKSENGHASALFIGNAHALNSRGTLPKPLEIPSALEQDPVLKLLLQEKPMYRDRVALNDRGVAVDKQKFDQIMLPAGVRFSVDILLNTTYLNNMEQAQREQQWTALLACWQSPLFAVGSHTRNGLGQLAVVAATHECINLSQGASAGKQLAALRTKEAQPTACCAPFDQPRQAQYFAELPLQALDTWRCGKASALLGNKRGNTERMPDSFSYSEQVIRWQNGKSTGLDAKPVAILCGSSIKGILAHRVAYHWRRIHQQWADELHTASEAEWATRPAELAALFGIADETDHRKSLAGRLIVEDVVLDYQHTLVRQHNSIDRFTGGVRKGALFSEELLYQPRFTLKLSVLPGTTLHPSLKTALEATLADLQLGLLPMGAGSGRGNSLVMADESKTWNVDWSLVNVAEQSQGAAA